MKIIVIGDSWACGEWGTSAAGEYCILHGGLAHYLSANHEVVNLGEGGSCGMYAANMLKNAYDDSVDLVFWFKTDPLRSTDDRVFTQDKVTFDDIVRENCLCTEKIYKQLNDMDIPIHCMGGCAKLNLDLMKNYSNLIPYIKSIAEFLIPDYSHPELWISSWIKHINNRVDLDSLDKLLAGKREQDRLFDYKDLFWPDGLHPNRHGHKLLYDKICDDFGL